VCVTNLQDSGFGAPSVATATHAAHAEGRVLRLPADHLGSLKAVADSQGNLIQAIEYDGFGRVLEAVGEGPRPPLGFAGGLFDADTGLVRFGWRDYDPATGRFTAPDPMGDHGGDPDWYGYCLDDPVNAVDPLGLFRFGKRPLDGLPEMVRGAVLDKANMEIAHEQGFYEDGSGDTVGFGKRGSMDTEDIRDYSLDDRRYDDGAMRKAQQRVEPSMTSENYRLLGNNCQDAADALRREYRRLWRKQTLEKGEEDYGR
jgi:RHS repeat-associated protein